MKENEIKTQNNAENTSRQSKGKKVFKAIINTIINILIVLVLVVSVLIAALALTSKANNGISNIFGYTIQPIMSDSMKGGSPEGYEGGDFSKGDLMIAKSTNYDANAVYHVGDIVTYASDQDDGTTMLISHRIVNTFTTEEGILRYQTWGDNRAVAPDPDQRDESYYLFSNEIGSVFYSEDYHGTIIKGVGGFLNYIQSQQGFFLVVLLPMIIFFMYELIRVVLNASNYKRTKSKEDKDEAVKAAVAAALAEKENETKTNADTGASATPEDLTPEQMEQFKQFIEFQKMQKSSQNNEHQDNAFDSAAE